MSPPFTILKYNFLHLRFILEFLLKVKIWKIYYNDYKEYKGWIIVIEVVGAVIVKGNKFLGAQRPLDKSLGGLWEFPGGKLENGETPEKALAREIKEELLCDIEVLDFIVNDVYNYDFGDISLSTYFCRLNDNDPVMDEHMDMQWIEVSEIDNYDWAPADYATLDILKVTNLKEV